DAVALGRRLRELRIASGLTGREVKARTGIDPGGLSRVERGTRFPTIEILSTLAKVYGVRVHDLLDPDRRPGDPLGAERSAHPRMNDLGIIDSSKFREAAQAQVYKGAPRAGTSMAGAARSALMHELEVRGVELEMQIEELRRLRNAAEEAGSRYVDLFEFAPDGYVTLDAAGSITGANLTAATLLGISRGRLRGSRFAFLVATEHASAWQGLFSRARQGEEKQVGELQIRRGDGTVFDAQVTCQFIHGSDQESEARIALTDISGRKRLERELRDSEALFRGLFENHTAVKLIIDPETGRIVDANLAAASFYGWPVDRLRQMRIQDLNTLTPEKIAEEMERARSQKRTHFEFHHRMADGSVRDVEVRSKKLDFKGKDLLHSIIHDITERKQAEEAVRNGRALLLALANSSPDAIFAKDLEGRWTFVNTAALEVVSKPAEEVLGRTDAEILGNAERALSLTRNDLEVLESGEPRTFEETLSVPAGVRTYLSSKAPLRDAEGRVIGIVGVAKNITEIRMMENQLAVASRLAAMGTLVAGVAHEINNPLSGVLAGGGIALELTQDARRLATGGTTVDREELARLLEGAVESFEDARQGGQRIAQIVKDLSLFAHPDPMRVRVRIIEIVDQAMRWLPKSVAGSATLRLEDLGAPDVMGSFGQIGQVLVNLVTNASKAMARGRKAEVVIRLGPGGPGMARIEVIDNGVGMAPDVAERIFDPFFTTRAIGEGTGLGLSIIHAIVTAHGGTISVQSEVGKGSTFRVELPAAPAE
ncbi:MAG: PAS domain S-box protein, partial [Deltaproteobacteria bacterium]